MKRVPPSVRMKEEVEALLQGQGTDPELGDAPMDGFIRGTARYLLQVAKEGVLSAYALLEDGTPVLLHLDVGVRESYDAWLSFLQDLVARGVRDPLLVILIATGDFLAQRSQRFIDVSRGVTTTVVDLRNQCRGDRHPPTWN